MLFATAVGLAAKTPHRGAVKMIASLVSPSLTAYLLAAPGIRLGRAIVRRIGRRLGGVAIVTACLAPVATCSLPTPAYAEPVIAWGSAQTISGDSNVDTNGTLLYAYRFGNSLTGTTTVNGVSFEPFNVTNGASTATVGSVTLTAVSQPGYNAVMYSGDGATSGSNPFAALPASYQSLLSGVVQSVAFDTDPGQPLSIQLGGLTAGTEYLVQWWSSTPDTNLYWKQTVALGSPNVTLDSNTTDVAGGLGQYATGTFTASGSTFTFTLEGLQMYASPYDWPTINALQVREIQAVPEPSTLAMAFAGLGFVGYSRFRRRKRA